MIGQVKLRDNLTTLINSKSFPRFAVITGQRGSGKKLLCDFISEQLVGKSHTIILPDVKIDTIRTMIDQAYSLTEPYLYLLQDADDMSIGAKNSILKLVEEPPNNVYIIMTLKDMSNTLDTIRSRAIVYTVDNYSERELVSYGKQKFGLVESELDIVKNVAKVPYDVDLLVNSNIHTFMEFVRKVYNKVSVVEGANSFKIGTYLSFKQEPDKYDLLLFWRAFISICMEDVLIDPIHACNGIIITSNYIRDMRISGINLSNTFDMWLLDIRKAWMQNDT